MQNKEKNMVTFKTFIYSSLPSRCMFIFELNLAFSMHVLVQINKSALHDRVVDTLTGNYPCQTAYDFIYFIYLI